MTIRMRDSKRTEVKEKIDKKGKSKKVFGLEVLESVDTLPQGYLSVSQITMYVRCGKQYEFRYIKKKKIPPGIALVEGGCHHDAIGMNVDHKVDKGKNLKDKIVIEKFCDEFWDKSKSIPKREWILFDEKRDNVIDRGKLLLTNYMTDIAPTLKPIKPSEGKIEIMVGKYPFIGFIDLEEKKRITDYKVTKQAKSQKEADSDLQLTIYSKARKIKQVAFCCLTKTKAGAIKTIESERGENNYLVAEMIVDSVADAILKGAFPMCDPTNVFPCSEKWCGYWFQCRGKF